MPWRQLFSAKNPYNCFLSFFFVWHLLPTYCKCRGWLSRLTTFRRITVGRTRLDEWSVRSRDLKQHTTLTTDIHATGGIGTRSPSKRAAVDPCFIQSGHWDRPLEIHFTDLWNKEMYHTFKTRRVMSVLLSTKCRLCSNIILFFFKHTDVSFSSQPTR